LLIFCNIQHGIAAQAGSIINTVAVGGKRLLLLVKQVEAAAIGSYPYPTGMVFLKTFYIVIAQAVCANFLPVNIEFFCTRVIQVYAAAVGAYPKVALPVFKYGRYGALAQAIRLGRLVGVFGKALRIAVEEV
jgi:hypothetical protein